MVPKIPPTLPLSGTISRKDRAEAPAEPTLGERVEDDGRFLTHLLTVLSVSAGMVGVCLTAIGLIGVMKSLSRVETVVDDLLAISAMLFMVTAVLSFLGMRTNLTKSWRSFARTVDGVFCLGLVLVGVATLLLTWVVL
jgi:hypothetical protein